MTEARAPAVSGMFYPADRGTLKAQVAELLQDVGAGSQIPKAIIAPHAGYSYSGPVAASAYGRIAPARGQIRRVVLLGPAHRVPVPGLALCSAPAWRTPLGDVPVAAEALASLTDLAEVQTSDLAHQAEHSLEVHLPFLQASLGDFELVPILVGEAPAELTAEVLRRLWGGQETLIVVSSDLSHYLDYATAQRLDRATSAAIEALAPEHIGEHQACGRHPIAGLLTQAKRQGLRVTTVDQRSSGDTAGPRDQVVGYGAYVFEE